MKLLIILLFLISPSVIFASETIYRCNTRQTEGSPQQCNETAGQVAYIVTEDHGAAGSTRRTICISPGQPVPEGAVPVGTR